MERGRRKLDIKTGSVFNRLKVIREVEPKTTKAPTSTKRFNRTYRVFECECACGRIVDVRLNSLRSGNTKSCGCLHTERNENRYKK